MNVVLFIVVVLGDRLTCFGKLENIRRDLCEIQNK